ncbi:small ribosomal subunit Rsm22 family protein [Haloplanus aerogenes]|uniref:Class I SAM-dependent methyltransferase n=1 Tax=Haloplanus aerogenes TaxID=660522 RepID=A0A3M0CYE4_9EURY|nr:methyltransferase domain-containing protein [Haloplanus aerogenes]AZH25065.1 class I SAM-dependent methyltransferase [Haloplanus aerogenes]RMB13715.1 methyltransferase family protein [Haloplanus aerogenes]
MIDREAVRSNAKYLRQVRPIDPDEISEYVEETPHPAVVRRVLREEAYDLGLYEREDGSFVPVDEEPVSAPGWEPREFPERYTHVLEDLLVDRYGVNWHRDESGAHLREVIRRLKEDYYYRNPVEYDAEVALGYAVYHLPDYYAAVGYVLDDLVERACLPRRLRVLDIGAGVGGPALGLHDYLPDDAVVDYHAVEPSAAADVLDDLLDETRRNFRATIHREHVEEFAFDGPYDLVVCANVLSELDEPTAVAGQALDALAEDGTLLALAPADLETSTGLREVERELVSDRGATVYAPTLRLWPGLEPADHGWSFDERPRIEAPHVQRRLDDAGGEPGTFRNETVKFSYALLRTDGMRRVDVRGDRSRHARMVDMEDHVTDRIDLLAVKLSRNLSDGGNPLYKVGDGSEQLEHYAVLTRESGLNRALGDADYGAVLQFENVLALWNDDEGAYNLVVDDEAVVDMVG